MRWNAVPTELTTAATDAVLAILCVALLGILQRQRVASPWKRNVWAAVFALLAASSALGAVAHGLDLGAAVRTALWVPLYLSLGGAVAMFVVAAVADWRGEGAARRFLPWALAVGAGFFAVTQLVDSFAVFIAYEAVAMLTALWIYVSLWRTGRPGAGTVAMGIALTLVAAIVQTTPLRARLFWEFDHNGLFHLVQMLAMVVVALGVRRGLIAK